MQNTINNPNNTLNSFVPATMKQPISNDIQTAVIDKLATSGINIIECKIKSQTKIDENLSEAVKSGTLSGEDYLKIIQDKHAYKIRILQLLIDSFQGALQGGVQAAFTYPSSNYGNYGIRY